jgi:hypothetical protein
MPQVYSGTVLLAASSPAPDNDGTFFDWPVWIWGPNGTTYSSPYGAIQVKGLVPDLALCSETFLMGGVDNVAGSITSMHLGPFWLPSNGVPLL